MKYVAILFGGPESVLVGWLEGVDIVEYDGPKSDMSDEICRSRQHVHVVNFKQVDSRMQNVIDVTLTINRDVLSWPHISLHTMTLPQRYGTTS